MDKIFGRINPADPGGGSETVGMINSEISEQSLK